jgi:hypothetical protein
MMTMEKPETGAEEAREQSIAEIIREASAPTGEMAELHRQAARLRRALDVASRWVKEATGSTEMFEWAMCIEDEIEKELSRALFEMKVVEDGRLFSAGRKDRGERGEDSSPLEEEAERAKDRAATISNTLIDVYTFSSEAPLEAFVRFGGDDNVAIDQARYKFMGALLAAQDALHEE